VFAEREYLELVDIEGPQLPKARDSSRASESYRRIGLTVGSIFAVFPIVLGLFFARTGLEHIPARLNRDSQTVADRRVLSSH